MRDRVLHRVLQMGKILLCTRRLEEAWPRLMSVAAADPLLRSAVLVTRRDPDQPLAWWREPGSAERHRALARARARLERLGSGPGPRQPREEARFFACPLLDQRGDALGILQLEWPGAPTEPDLAFASALADQLAAALEGLAREEARVSLHVNAAADLLATVSHEIKNLISVVTSNVALLNACSAGVKPEQFRGALDRIQRATFRMRHLADDLLDQACVDAGELTVEPRRLEVAPAVAEALEVAAPLAAERSIRLQGEAPSSLPSIRADGARLQQVFTNLIGNAIKFSPEQGTITVRAQPSGGQVRFSVANDGPHIPPEDLPHLFDRFWRAKPTIRQGVGLGLYIVKGIVQAHGGRVWVENRGRVGTTFFFTIPVAEMTHPTGVSSLDMGPGR